MRCAWGRGLVSSCLSVFLYDGGIFVVDSLPFVSKWLSSVVRFLVVGLCHLQRSCAPIAVLVCVMRSFKRVEARPSAPARSHAKAPAALACKSTSRDRVE